MTLVKLKRPAGNGYITSPYFPANVNELFDNLFINKWNTEERANFVPATNIVENEKDFRIELSAPGFNKTDIKVEVENDTLVIKGEHKEEKNETKENYTRKEFNYGSFTRSFTLPENINTETLEAKYENGILNIVLPKKTEEKVKAVKEVKIV
jgi:HSP20 family protein